MLVKRCDVCQKIYGFINSRAKGTTHGYCPVHYRETNKKLDEAIKKGK